MAVSYNQPSQKYKIVRNTKNVEICNVLVIIMRECENGR